MNHAPPTTTTAPSTTTTAAAAANTAAPPAATTAAPAAATTAAPAATTAAPAAATTDAPAATTAAPAASTTAAPAASTTAAPAASTTAAPAASTTAAAGASTTAAPGSTSTAGGGTPTIEDVSVDVDPDDGADHHARSIQVATDAKLKLNWKTQGATEVKIDPLTGPFDASGSTDLDAKDATYTLVAVSGAAQSDPWTLEIHTHDPAEVVSQHVDVSSGLAKVVAFTASLDGNPVQSAAPGASIELKVVVSVDTESAKVGEQDVELTDSGDGNKQGTVTLTVPDTGPTVSYQCTATKSGADPDTATLSIDVGPPTTTTAPITSTTTHADSSTTAPPPTTTQPASTTTHPATTTTHPATTTTHGAPVISTFEADTSQLDELAQFTLSWKIDGYDDSLTVALAVDVDPDGNGLTPQITTAGDGTGTLVVILQDVGTFNYTLTVTPKSGDPVTKTAQVQFNPEMEISDVSIT